MKKVCIGVRLTMRLRVKGEVLGSVLEARQRTATLYQNRYGVDNAVLSVELLQQVERKEWGSAPEAHLFIASDIGA